MKTRRVAFSLLFVLLLAGVPVLADDAASGVLNESSLAEAAIKDIQKINRALKKNLAAQEKAWPTRELDQENEKAAPPKVKKLEVTQIKLERRRERRLRALRRYCGNDVSPILVALRRTRSRAFLDAVIPVAVKVGKDDPRLLRVLKKLERRFDVCPPSVVNGLADLGKGEASLSILELGMKEKSLSVLRAAGKSGDPVVLSQLITAAESNDKALAKVCRKTITRLTPPSHPTPNLVGLLLQRISDVRSSELKTSLIVYLGLCKSKESLVPLKKIYKEDRNPRVRAAVIGALANFGSEITSEFVLHQLKKKTLPMDLEKSCIHALGAVRYRPAIPYLVDFMDDATQNRAAARALRRISGRNFGFNKGPWLRWWRAQPEATGYKDPDE